ncbi:MAG: zinc ABC transporter substrate-binding protein [Erysipelotrichaceae bacterium]|nr:zinc ABC transporter substrate-binding protein [Erysipelotrichaceae bacterium]
MKMLKKLIICLLVLSLTACSSKGSSGVRSYHTYTVYPIGYLLNRIGGNRINTVSIQTSASVQNANIIDNSKIILDKTMCLYSINGLEPYFEVYEKEIESAGLKRLDLSKSSIYAFKRYTPVMTSGNYTFVESDYYDGDAFTKLDTYTDDLFIWLDPIGMLSMAKLIYNNLANNYVEQKAYFEANYTALESDLISLDAAYQNLATSLKKENKTIKFVSMTASFGSWQKAYGIETYPVCLSKYGALPTKSQLDLIKKRIIEDKVEYIAYEPNMSADMLGLFMQLESELNLKRVNLSNLSSLTVTQQTDNKDYLKIMYENLAVLENLATSVLQKNSDVGE